MPVLAGLVLALGALTAQNEQPLLNAFLEQARDEHQDAVEMARLHAERERSRGWATTGRRLEVQRRIDAIRNKRSRALLVRTARAEDFGVSAARRDALEAERITVAQAARPMEDLLQTRVRALEEERAQLGTWADVDARRRVDTALVEARRQSEAWLRPATDTWPSAAFAPAMLELQDRVTALTTERQTLRTWADNARRAQVDGALAEERRVADHAEEALASRMDMCTALAGLPVTLPGRDEAMALPGPAAQQCLAESAAMVVPTETHMEELRRRLSNTRWTWSNADERRALKAELASLESGGL